MRTIIALALTLGVVATGCSTTRLVQPPARDHKTPIALGKPSVANRIMEQRLQKAQVASGSLSVEGQLRR